MSNIRTFTATLFLLIGLSASAATTPQATMPTPTTQKEVKEYLRKQYRLHAIIDICLATVAIAVGLVCFLIVKHSRNPKGKIVRFTALYVFGGFVGAVFCFISCIIRSIILTKKTGDPAKEPYRIQASNQSWITDATYVITTLLFSFIIHKVGTPIWEATFPDYPFDTALLIAGLGGCLFLASVIARGLLHLSRLSALAAPQKSPAAHTKPKKKRQLLLIGGHVANVIILIILPLLGYYQVLLLQQKEQDALKKQKQLQQKKQLTKRANTPLTHQPPI